MLYIFIRRNFWPWNASEQTFHFFFFLKRVHFENVWRTMYQKHHVSLKSWCSTLSPHALQYICSTALTHQMPVQEVHAFDVPLRGKSHYKVIRSSPEPSDCVYPSGEHVYLNGRGLVQDGSAPMDRTLKLIEWFHKDTNDVNAMLWPSDPSDHNPVEHLPSLKDHHWLEEYLIMVVFFFFICHTSVCVYQ